jgi:hypothetical protein
LLLSYSWPFVSVFGFSIRCPEFCLFDSWKSYDRIGCKQLVLTERFALGSWQECEDGLVLAVAVCGLRVLEGAVS